MFCIETSDSGMPTLNLRRLRRSVPSPPTLHPCDSHLSKSHGDGLQQKSQLATCVVATVQLQDCGRWHAGGWSVLLSRAALTAYLRQRDMHFAEFQHVHALHALHAAKWLQPGHSVTPFSLPIGLMWGKNHTKPWFYHVLPSFTIPKKELL
jgi:hypothetical protein